MTQQERFEVLKVALEHGRSMFVYHAGQRLTSIRFFIAALAAVIAGQGTLFSADSTRFAELIPIGGIILGIIGVVISLCFWALDFRNARLVDCDEALLDRVERDMAQLCEIAEYRIIGASDNYGSYPRWVTYSHIMPFLFAFFIVVQIGAIFFAANM